jgi:hypothetical protein
MNSDVDYEVVIIGTGFAGIGHTSLVVMIEAHSIT